MDDITSDPNAAKLWQAILNDLEPYNKQIGEGLERVSHLGRVAVKLTRESPLHQKTADDIFRSIVVMTHAYLEDFLRTLGQSFLPSTDECSLNLVPIVGSNSGRAEKFFLGRLAQHRGKLVDDLIRESVEEHLSRSTFNSVTEIKSFLQQIGLEITNVESLPKIEAMIKRRHLIVHRADRVEGQIQSIDSDEVLVWVEATQLFMQKMFRPIVSKRFTPKYLEEKYEIKVSGS
jgi:hypothetical protein